MVPTSGEETDLSHPYHPPPREVKKEQLNSNYIPGKAEMFGLSMKLISLYELFSRPLAPLWKKQSVCCSLSVLYNLPFVKSIHTCLISIPNSI